MTPPRRLTFQLTPLLDLLLIVIFAQFMDVRETTQKQEQNSAAQLTEADQQLASTREELAQLRLDRQEAQAEIDRQKQAIADLEQSLNQKSATSGESQALLEVLQRERNITAKLLAELLRITPEETQQVAASIDDEAQRTAQASDYERRLKELSNQNTPADAVRHAMMFEELSKRCDIWQLHIDGTGFTTLTTGHGTARFQAYTAKEFERELFQAYKSQPPPNHLVLMLLSHANTDAGFIEAADTGLRETTDRMRKDQSDRVRFEYAMLGYIPAPIFEPPSER